MTNLKVLLTVGFLVLCAKGNYQNSKEQLEKTNKARVKFYKTL